MNKARRDIRLLLVEDNVTNQEVAVRILQHLGYEQVEVAPDGRQALRALAERDFDLVLMDCHLPDIDGYEASRQIRNRASSVRDHDIPIVATTAAAMDGDRRKCLEAGMNAYLAKPLRFDALEQTIEEWTGGSPATHRPIQTRQTKAAGKAPIFDAEALQGALMGNKELARRILRTFVGDMPRQIARLAQAVSDANAPQVRLLAHSIKGAAASVSGFEMRDVSGKLELQGRDGELARSADTVRELSASFERTRPAMERFCSANPDD